MRKVNFCIVFLLLMNTFVFSQKNEEVQPIQNVPKSIYTLAYQTNENSFSAINKRLQLTSFTFVIFDDKYREFDYFRINPKSFKKNAYTVIDNDLFRFKEKSFQFKIDPTLWPASYFSYK